MNLPYVKSLRRTMRILSLIIFILLSLNDGMVDAFFPPGRRGPGHFWPSRRYEQVIDRVDECRQIDGRARSDDLAVGDRGFIDKDRACIFQVRLDTPPAGGALAASQSGIRKDPWAVADRSDDLARRRRRLDEADRLGIAAQRIGIPDAARNDHNVIVLGGSVLQK